MYEASNAFHEAVRNGNHQMPLLIFADAVFTQSDLDVDSGIEFDDNFNMENDLAIGQATSNEIRFTLFNDDRLLNDYEFGEFVATLGVQVSRNTYQQTSPVTITTLHARYDGYNARPFLRRNDVALAAQPSFAVKSLLGYDGKVWAFSGDGRYAVYDDATGTNITQQNNLNDFMKNKSRSWNGKGFFYNSATRRLAIYDGGTRYWYEFVPLGTFIAERPKVPDQISIDMTCHDRMTKLDKDMPTKEELHVTYPTTVGGLFVKMCEYLEVPYVTSTFINSGAVIAKEPEDFASATMRQVMMWIAEAAGSNARFNRDGKLVMDWIRQTGQKYSETDYVDFQPTWYETKVIDKLYSRDTYSGQDTIVGSGETGYLIQDNPFMK